MAGFRDGDAPAVAISNPPYSPMWGFRPRPITSNPWTSPKLPISGGEAEKPSETKMVEQDDDDDRWDGGDEDSGVAGTYSRDESHDEFGDPISGRMNYRHGDGGTADKTAAAEALGYQAGQTAPGEAIVKGLGLLSGIPGAGTLAGKASDKLSGVTPWFSLEEGTPKAGQVGTYDVATGDVYGTGVSGVTRGYDPITGRATSNFTGAGDAWNSWNNSYSNLRGAGYNPVASALGSWENSQAYNPDSARAYGVTPASRAGLMTLEGEKSIDALLAGDTGPQHLTSTGRIVDSSGIINNAPGAGTTFASGNLKTDNTGKVVAAQTKQVQPDKQVSDYDYLNSGPTFSDDDDNFGGTGNTYSQQVEAEKNVGLDAFGGSGDDSGGGGGGGK